jgi:Ca2+-binding RTX toxin-like protein
LRDFKVKSKTWDFSEVEYDGTISGNNLNNSIVGNNLNDQIFGKGGNDILNGSKGSDLLLGQEGKDKLFGGGGNDWLQGGLGSDLLQGNGGHDRIEGEEGNDKLIGGRGNDWLAGGMGKDTLRGGLGEDVFFLAPQQGRDVILDFQNGIDLIELDEQLTFDNLQLSTLNTKDVLITINKPDALYDGQALAVVKNVDIKFIFWKLILITRIFDFGVWTKNWLANKYR